MADINTATAAAAGEEEIEVGEKERKKSPGADMGIESVERSKARFKRKADTVSMWLFQYLQLLLFSHEVCGDAPLKEMQTYCVRSNDGYFLLHTQVFASGKIC